MIIFKTLSWRNFLSTGHQPTKITLDSASTTLILGHNGSGKSTILDALMYALFKKPFRKINKNQILNAINNGESEVEILFTIGTKEYKIRRGIKPDFFELLIDGKPRPEEGARKDDQKYLEEDILKIDYDAFKQVVILGNADYTPFMQLKTPDRRDFIEQILDIGVFSVMNDILKTRQTAVKSRLDTISKDTHLVREQMSLVQGFISKLEAEAKKAKDHNQGQIDQGNDSIETLMATVSSLNDEAVRLGSLIEDADAVADELKEHYDIQRRGTVKIKEAEKIIAFYTDNDKCNTCSQDIEQAFRTSIVAKNEAIITTVTAGLLNVDKKVAAKQSRQKEIVAIQKQIQKLNSEVQETSSTIRATRTYVAKLEQDMNKQPGNVQEQYDRLSELDTKGVKLESDREEAIERKHCYEVAGVLLKDTGIKAAIIKQYLPMINKLVNKYLADLDFFLSFTLDEAFNESFKSRHRDSLSYFSFSEGEKLKIDLALLFTWREIARQKNSCATNLLILDEVIDSSLDQNGTDFFIKMLHDLGAASNVFVISHKSDAALDKFKDVIRFEKRANFSRMVEQV